MKTPDQEFTDAMVAKLDAIERPKKVLTGGLADPRGYGFRSRDNVDHVVFTAFGWQVGVASRYLIDFRPPRDHTERFRAVLLFARRVTPGAKKMRTLIVWRGRRSPWRTLNTYGGFEPAYVAVEGATHPGRRRWW